MECSTSVYKRKRGSPQAEANSAAIVILVLGSAIQIDGGS